YCGVGSISLFIANNVETVTGVECNPEAVMIAKKNALINAVPNAVFIESDAMNYISTYSDDYDVIVVDPPRTGLEQKVVQKLLDIHAKRIVYMSCNPITFASDAGAIMQEYTLQFCKAYDMFPQTQHVELLAVFDRT
ncbi:MAG TPA: methyltransferase, partial [Spirochaetota bacterium]|nr:methyltransferase [Spirochaetota bacterium]